MSINSHSWLQYQRQLKESKQSYQNELLEQIELQNEQKRLQKASEGSQAAWFRNVNIFVSEERQKLDKSR